MSWKKVKEYYKIEHIVSVKKDTGDIQIGSPYISDIIVVTKEGKFLQRYERAYNTTGDRLDRYQKEMEADIPKLVELINSPDSFCASKPVYSYDYDTGKIVENYCEEYKWPNCTHKGSVMYDNVFFEDRRACVEYTLDGLKSRIECHKERIIEYREKQDQEMNGKIKCETRILDLEINKLLTGKVWKQNG